MLKPVAEIPNRARELRLDPVLPSVTRRGVVSLIQNQEASRQHRPEPFAHRIGIGGVGQEPV